MDGATTARPSPWMRDYLRRLDRDRRQREHEAALRAIRERGAARRRREDASHRLDIERADRSKLAAAQRYHWLHLERAEATLPDEVELLPIWERDITETARRLGIEVCVVPDCAGTNASAWASLRRVEIPPIRSSWSYCAARHELAHVERPCDRQSHKRRAMWGGWICVRCELNAWLRVTEAAVPSWTKRNHALMAQALRTYRYYATADEQLEIDRLTSSLGFAQVVLDRLRQGKDIAS